MVKTRPNEVCRERNQNRAVSPVIGVILMVAITVILAAVIGAFVLEIGDQQETAPSTSFNTEEQLQYYQTVTGNPTSGGYTSCWPGCTSINVSEVEFTHAGGDTIGIDNVELKVEGNDSVWGVRKPIERRSVGNFGNYIHIETQPNICKTAGTNEEVTFTSGQTWRATFYSGDDFNMAQGGTPLTHDNEDHCSAGEYSSMIFEDSTPQSKLTDLSGSNAMYGTNALCTGDAVTIVWEASSGGKTQSLQRYTVQQDSEFC